MSTKNPYLLSAAQIRRWAGTHNEEAWLLLMKLLEGQNEYFSRKRGEDSAQAIQRLESDLAKGGIPEARALQLRKVLVEIKSVSGSLQKAHESLREKLSGLSGSTRQLEEKLEILRKLKAKKLGLDSKRVKDIQAAREAARKRELQAREKADALIARARDAVTRSTGRAV